MPCSGKIFDHIIHKLFLIFIDPVTFTKVIPNEVSKSFGSSITIDCSAFGKPTPSLTWYKDGVELTSTGRITITNTTTNSTHVQSILVITSLMDGDEATYKCIGTNTLPNGIATQSISFTLNVAGSK